MNKVINTQDAPAPIGPYNQAILAGNTLYVSGQIAINPQTGELVQSSIVHETKQVLENLKVIVEEAGFTLEDVVKTSIFLSKMDFFNTVNGVYAEYFTNDSAPARETIAVSTLPKEVNVEISAIAVKQ